MGRSQWLNQLVPAAGSAIVGSLLRRREADDAFKRQLELIARQDMKQQEADDMAFWKDRERKKIEQGKLDAAGEEKKRQSDRLRRREVVDPIADLLEGLGGKYAAEGAAMRGQGFGWEENQPFSPARASFGGMVAGEEQPMGVPLQSPAGGLSEAEKTPAGFGQRARDYMADIPMSAFEQSSKRGRNPPLTFEQRVKLKMIDYANKNNLNLNRMTRQQLLEIQKSATRAVQEEWKAGTQWEQSPIGGMSGATPRPSTPPAPPEPPELPLDPARQRRMAPRGTPPMRRSQPAAAQLPGQAPRNAFEALKAEVLKRPKWRKMSIEHPERFRRALQNLVQMQSATKGM